MKKQPEKPASPTLRAAYKVSGFRVRARIDGYEDLKPPAFILTLDRRSKKRGAADVGTFAAAFTANGGDVCVISVAGSGKSLSTSKCAA